MNQPINHWVAKPIVVFLTVIINFLGAGVYLRVKRVLRTRKKIHKKPDDNS